MVLSYDQCSCSFLFGVTVLTKKVQNCYDLGHFYALSTRWVLVSYGGALGGARLRFEKAK